MIKRSIVTNVTLFTTLPRNVGEVINIKGKVPKVGNETPEVRNVVHGHKNEVHNRNNAGIAEDVHLIQMLMVKIAKAIMCITRMTVTVTTVTEIIVITKGTTTQIIRDDTIITTRITIGVITEATIEAEANQEGISEATIEETFGEVTKEAITMVHHKITVHHKIMVHRNILVNETIRRDLHLTNKTGITITRETNLLVQRTMCK